MSHQIIITTNQSLVALPATGEITWSPSHDLSPNQQQRRIERAETKLNEIVAMLSAPPAGHDD